MRACSTTAMEGRIACAVVENLRCFHRLKTPYFRASTTLCVDPKKAVNPLFNIVGIPPFQLLDLPLALCVVRNCAPN